MEQFRRVLPCYATAEEWWLVIEGSTEVLPVVQEVDSASARPRFRNNDVRVQMRQPGLLRTGRLRRAGCAEKVTGALPLRQSNGAEAKTTSLRHYGMLRRSGKTDGDGYPRS